MATTKKKTPKQRPAGNPAPEGMPLLDARPDTADFRDRMFEPTLVDVPTESPLEHFIAQGVPILDQGSDGACTAFGLATVAHALLRRRRPEAETGPVSTRMLYDMARRYDEWEGEGYSGSSCRGAMKAWHRHGVCSEALWPYVPGLALEPYTDERARDALRNPLGAYYRVNHKDLVAMHAATGPSAKARPNRTSPASSVCGRSREGTTPSSEARRRGYARRLLHEGFAELQVEGVTRCLLEVRESNTAAIALYRALGFFYLRYEGFPVGEGRIFRSHQRHPLGLQGAQYLYRRSFVDAGHDGCHRGHSQIELIAREQSRRFRAAFGHDQLERGDRFAVGD